MFDVCFPNNGCLITMITPLYKLGQHQDIILWFILIIYALIFISLFPDFQYFCLCFCSSPSFIAWGSEAILSYPNNFWDGAGLCSGLSAVHCFTPPLPFSTPAAFPAFKSKADIAYPHLSLALWRKKKKKRKTILFFLGWKTCLNI